MTTIRNSQFWRSHNNFAQNFNSIVGANPRRLRSVAAAAPLFQKGTIAVNLYPRLYCPIYELPLAIREMQKIFRAIVNSDMRYQQRLGNLPTFQAVRNICVRHTIFNGDTQCYPFIRVFVDNEQIAAFIVMRWCARTGILPKSYNVVEVVNNKQSYYEDVFHKSNPFHLEILLRNRNVKLVKFGSAAELSTCVTDDDYKRDIYPIAGVAISRSFGHRLSVYAMRNVARDFIASNLDDFYDHVLDHPGDYTYVRRLKFDKWVWRRVKCVSRSYYGAYHYKQRRDNRYASARDSYLSAHLKHDALLTHNAAMSCNYTAWNKSNDKSSSLLLTQSFNILRAMFDKLKLRVKVAEAKAAQSASCLHPTTSYDEDRPVIVNARRKAQNTRRIKETIFAALTAKPVVYEFIKPFEVEVAIHKLRELFPVEVNNGVATIQLRR